MQLKHKRFDQLSSTQDYLLENLEFFEDYSIVSTAIQTSGYGRTGTWDGNDKHIYMSIKVPKSQVDISELVLVTLQQLCNEYGIDSRIKLPNDIYVSDKKMAGFIINESMDHYIVGIGMNIAKINHHERTSFCNEINYMPNICSIIEQIAIRIEMLNKTSKNKLNFIFNENLEIIDKAIKVIDRRTSAIKIFKVVRVENGMIYTECGQYSLLKFKFE